MKLQPLAALLLCLSVFALPSFAAAQDDNGGDPPVEGSGGVVRTGKKTPRVPTSVRIPLKNLPKEAVGRLLTDVRAIEHPVYVCRACSFRSREAGHCLRCEAELEDAGTSKAVAKAGLSVDRRFLSVALNPRHWGSLGELDEVLRRVEARVDREDFLLPPYSRLSITGLNSDAGTKVRAALKEAGLFTDVSVATDPSETVLWVLPRVDAPVTMGAVSEALAKRLAEAVVADAQWTAPCESCAKRGAIKMSCVACWQLPRPPE